MKVFTKEEEEKMISNAFDMLLSIYGASNHKHKFDVVRKAFEFAQKAHEGVKRRDGEPYIMHPIKVATICVQEMGLGSTSICAALLHDVVEDTEYTVEDIKTIFGNVIANIVDGLTKISGGIFGDSASQQAANFQKLILTIPSDVRVVMIKIADRLHNMRTLNAMPPLKQQKITGETLYIYIPLAERLGFFNIKTELENLCLKYQQPELYRELEEKITKITPRLEAKIDAFIVPIKAKLDAKGLNYTILKRIKSPFSIYKKQEKQDVSFEEIYDLLAVRIILDEPYKNDNDVCWSVFGDITSIYPEHPKRTRNWLTTPKSNGYRALHLTVMRRGDKGEVGSWVEVQIRTKEMDEIAERGLAAHWKYKNGIEEQSEFDEWFRTVKDLLSMENIDSMDFVDKFQMNLATKEVIVFTPKGDIKRLPAKSTILDFAYSLHTELGNQCIGGKIDKKLVPISTELKSGNQIEILSSKTQRPETSWLDIAKTQYAISKIKSFLKPEFITLQKEGKEQVEKILHFYSQKITNENIYKLKKYFKYDNLNDFFVDVAMEKVDLDSIDKNIFIDKKRSIFPFFTKNRPPQAYKLEIDKKEVYYITDEALACDVVSIANCCKPIKGDSVIGFLLKDNQIDVHKLDCPNAQRHKAMYGNKIRLVEWHKDTDSSYVVTLDIEGIDRQGLLRQILNIISEDVRINIKNLNFSTIDGTFYGSITIMAHSNKEVETLASLLMKIKSIHRVQRVKK